MKSELYLSHPDAQFWADFSFVDFPENYLDKMKGPIEDALAQMKELEGGSIANPDESRMVGHYWLRNPSLAPSKEISSAIQSTLTKIKDITESIHSGSLKTAHGNFTDLLVIGIGGSALGPQFVGRALGHPKSDLLKVHFFDNTDPDGIDLTLAEIGPDLKTTLVLVISKSGGTAETRNGMLEAENAFENAGLNFAAHSIAITGEGSKLYLYAQEKGWLDFLPMWDWVGGRFSLWSSVGLSISLSIGFEKYLELLEGARNMDLHFRNNEFSENMLFATLDPKMRAIKLNNKLKIIISDTVGFISDLPTELIAAFRATLEEVSEADILIHKFDNLLIECAKDVGASVIFRGLRAVSDFEYEFQMVGMNRALDGRIETVFLMSDVTHQATASKLVKEISRLGGKIDNFVPEEVAVIMNEKFKI